MALVLGTRLGPYEIVGPLGAGGMGEVYRAVDTRLDRTVAIKVLPSHLSADPLFRQRFVREARTISSLSHPNICALHDIGHQDGMDYLVMEFLEGETLAQRVGRGRLTIEQTLQHGIQIADALDRAHKQGIIHRDLKPGNIMLTRSGAKLLDFGLAKFHLPSAKATRSGVSAFATEEPSNLTGEGSIVGTFQYMAPEQLEGKEVDARTDIFAMGVVLYEMATGQKAFTGTSHASLIAAILSSEPVPISQVQPMTPPAFDRVVKACMAKNPEDRWQTSHDVMLELRWIAEAGSQAGVPTPLVARRKIRERLVWLLAALFFVTTLSLAYTTFRLYQSQENVRPVRSTITAPEGVTIRLSGSDVGSLSISPNGRWLTFAATDVSGKTALWIRPLDSLKARLISGTENGQYPFWSPDSRFIGFFANGKLKKVDATGGPAITICDAARGRGGAWNQHGMILFTPNIQEPIYSVAAAGGTPTRITQLKEEKQESTHRFPYFLPDGKHFLYFAGSHKNPIKGESNAIYVASLDGKLNKLLKAGSNAAYANGFLLYLQERVLMAQHFDPANLELRGDPFPVAEQIQFATSWWNGAFSVSQNGILAYAVGSGDDAWQLGWFDRTGKQIQLLEDRAAYNFVALSPDEKIVAVAIADPDTGRDHIWLYELSSGVRTRFTFSNGNDSNALWSPDGTRVAYTNDGSGNDDIFQKPLTGTGTEEPLLRTDKTEVPTSWSPDGRFLCYESIDPKGKTKGDIWVLPLFGDRKPFPFLNTEFEENSASFSPDGKWIAYISDESGRPEVYVTHFPGRSGKWQVSKGGTFDGTFWRKDGRELMYLAPDLTLMSVPASTDPVFASGTPVALFNVRMSNHGDFSQDGQRILLSLRDSERQDQDITIVTNWTADLPR